MSNPVIVLSETDNVATALTDLAPDQTLQVQVGSDTLTVQVVDAVPFGHKVALRAIAAGEKVIKYSEAIGLARVDIPPGGYVHVHNVESQRGRGDLAG